MRESLTKLLIVLSKPAVAVGGAVVIGAALVGYAYVSTTAGQSGSTAIVSAGPITEEVDVSGTVKAAQDTDLAFQIPGRIASMNVAVGEHVVAGQTLLTLASASQAAALAEAKASLEVQQAKLASLSSGTRPEQLAIDETNVSQAQASLLNALQNAYVAADDAVHAKADQVFSNPRTTSATIAFPVPDANLTAKVESERVALEPMFSAWQGTLANAANDPEGAAMSVTSDLAQVSTFLDNLAQLLAETPAGGSLSSTALSGYQSSVNAARTEISGAVTGVLPGVTGALTGYKAAQGALALAQAGATADDIAAQQAAVDAAAAAVEAAQASLSDTVITAPVSGTITTQDANPGETVSPGVPLVSMVADGKYQATAEVSETDIGKVKVGDAVIATLDAYQGATFSAKVTTVDPSATVTNGISGYGVTVTFDTEDPRLSAGLSTNLRIITATKDSALQVPASAIITSGTSTFVYVKGPSGAVQTPVVTGIESADGHTEIVSGLSPGDAVYAYGASASQ